MTDRIEREDDELYRVDPDARDDEFDDFEIDEDFEGQRLAENEQEQPRTIAQKVANAIEDMIPGDGDNDGH